MKESDSHYEFLAGSPQYVLSEETVWIRRTKGPVSSKDLQAPLFKDESVFQQVSFKLRNKLLGRHSKYETFLVRLGSFMCS